MFMQLHIILPIMIQLGTLTKFVADEHTRYRGAMSNDPVEVTPFLSCHPRAVHRLLRKTHCFTQDRTLQSDCHFGTGFLHRL